MAELFTASQMWNHLESMMSSGVSLVRASCCLQMNCCVFSELFAQQMLMHGRLFCGLSGPCHCRQYGSCG